MIELSKQQAEAASNPADNPPKALSFVAPGSNRKVTLTAGPAQVLDQSCLSILSIYLFWDPLDT